MATLDEFLSGTPLLYTGRNGTIYLARYRFDQSLGLPRLRVIDGHGDTAIDLVTENRRAEFFFRSVTTLAERV